MTRASEQRATASPVGAGIVVREATDSDVDAVAALRVALLHENDGVAGHGRLHADAGTRAPRLCAQQLASTHDVFVIAESGGEAVGLLRCTESRASPLLLPERFAYVSSVYVRPRFRRIGVLHAMLQRADAWCRARGLTEMRLHNVPGNGAASAWAALGFGVVEEVRAREIGVH